jgi:aminoglycoside phosphotransferase (APT) family kinase protein
MQKTKGDQGVRNHMSVPSLPAPEPTRLLDALRRACGDPTLEFREKPRPLATGGEAVIDVFQLDPAPPGFAGPLVLRRLLPLRRPSPSTNAAQLRSEAAVHAALRELGFPVPRILHVEVDPTVLGASFLVSERASGEALLDEVRNPATLVAHPGRLPALLRDALFRVPHVLAGIQAHLHDLDAGALHRHLRSAGFAAEAIRFDARLEALAESIESRALSGIEDGLVWLRRHRPVGGMEVICHGDLVFTNLLVDGRRVTAVFDWSNVALAEPAYDVAATLARLTSRVPDAPRALDLLFRAVQRSLASRYLRAYRRHRTLDVDRLGYFEAYWILAELAWSGSRLREGAVFSGAIEQRWLHPATIAAGVERFTRTTGVRLSPLLPREA